MNRFDDLVFVSHDTDSTFFRERVLDVIPEEARWRALEIGCGAGATTVAIATRRERIEIVAYDISERNIAIANGLARDAGVDRQVDFVAHDFLGSEDGQFDIIFVKSVLYMMRGDDDLIARKLSANLKPGGLLVCVEPFRCARTLVLIALRRAFNLLPTRPIDWLAINIATLLYHAPGHVLTGRLPYLRLIPRRLDGDAWRKHLVAAGFEMVADEDWRSTSIAKLEHRLTIFRRAPGP